MTDDVEAPRFPQYMSEVAETKEEKGEGVSMDTSATSKPTWQYALTESELLPESDTLLLWLTRFSVEKNHPRPLTGRVQAYVAVGEVMALKKDEKLPQAFMKLVTEGFLGAPVIDAELRFVAFLDMLDLVRYVCDQFTHYMQRADEVSYVPSEPRLRQDWTTFLQLDRYQNATVADVLARPAVKRPPNFPTFRGFSTFNSVEQMARLGPHRVAVLDRERRVVGLLTQSMVVSLLDQNMHRLGAFRESRVRELLPTLASTPISIRDSALAIDAFNLCATNCVSGLGVVNDKGHLVDILSVRDLRGIGMKAEHFERLWQPVGRFKAETRSEFHRQTPPQPIHVSEDGSFERVIRLMDDGNIHRVFVVDGTEDGGMRPTHVITQRDVLRFLLSKMGLEPVWEVEPLP